MLATLAEFPHPGSIAWLRQTADHAELVEKVRILRDNADGTRLIAFASTGSFRHPASGNKTVPAADLFATRDEALLVPPRHGEVAARSADGGGRQPAPRKSRQPRRSAR